MKLNEVHTILEHISSGIKNIKDMNIKQIVSTLLNLVEKLSSDNNKIKKENQALKDAINILKGEQGKPEIKPNRKDGDISSEQDRKDAETKDADTPDREGFKLDKQSLDKLKENRIPIKAIEQLENLNGEKYTNEADFIKAVTSVTEGDLTDQQISLLIKYGRYKRRNRKSKLSEINIDREEDCPVDISHLPDDAEFKGYEYKVVQDLIIKSDNVRFKRDVYYSSSLRKTYIGKVPVGYEGEYGPHINSHIVSMKYVNNMSIPKINEFCKNFGILISGSYISTRLTKNLNIFHSEKSELYMASLENSTYQQIDDTASRVNGQNYYTQIVCNPLATVFFTTKRKDRLTILDVLRNFESRSFIFNDESFFLLEKLKVPKKLITLLHKIEKNVGLDKQEMNLILNNLFPNSNLGKLHRTRIMEASAIAYYHQETEFPIVKLLLGDDAPQFKIVTDKLSLCWIHDGRHYKRLDPIVPMHKEKLTAFKKRYWQYYYTLFKYKKNPSSMLAKTLSEEFDILFSTNTGYEDLDDRIVKSRNKKKELLIVLKHPEIPLHNNLSENGARVQKRREDVSLQTKTQEGTQAKDTMMSIVETCKKLGVSSYHYIYDRVSQTFKMPSLAESIKAKAYSQSTNHDTS